MTRLHVSCQNDPPLSRIYGASARCFATRARQRMTDWGVSQLSFCASQVFVLPATVTPAGTHEDWRGHCHGNWGGCKPLRLDGGVNEECDRESEEICVCVCVIGGCVSVVLHNYSEPCLTNIPLRYPTLFAWRSAKAPKQLASTPTNQHFRSSFPLQVHVYDPLQTWGEIFCFSPFSLLRFFSFVCARRLRPYWHARKCVFKCSRMDKNSWNLAQNLNTGGKWNRPYPDRKVGD